MKNEKLAIFRDPQGPLYHGGAVGYSLLAYGLGIAGLFDGRWLVNAGAILLLAHGMTIAAYMVHECAHNSVFRTKRHNARLGRVLMWICGEGEAPESRQSQPQNPQCEPTPPRKDAESFLKENGS